MSFASNGPLTALLIFAWAATAAAESSDARVAAVVFNRDIRPILSDNCFFCHGPDKNQRKADLRLDVREDAIKAEAFVPGKADESALVKRIFSPDPEELMPPADSHKRLTAREKDLLKRWIAEGAEYQGHWAYVPPKRPQMPSGGNQTPTGANQTPPSANAIDLLVDRRLKLLGLQPSPEADRTTLARRLYLDLLGLPPKPEEVDAFAADSSLDAYERLIERLLASPHYGERMAIGWLDVVRFADTVGYHSDTPRNVWPYRDYVIDAFNSNKPFDRFTLEQLAGDLLPDSGQEQKVASCFNRLVLSTEEGGAQAKDYEARMLGDRVRAVGAVWLGQTIGCCQCHDHKFDPFKSRDFYSLGAFFADIREPSIGKLEPGMTVTSPSQAAEIARLSGKIERKQQQLEANLPELAAAQEAWERQVLDESAAAPVWTVLHPEHVTSEKKASFKVEDDQAVTVGRKSRGVTIVHVTVKSALRDITGFRLEALSQPDAPAAGPGLAADGNFVLTEFSVTQQGKPLALDRATASYEQPDYPAAAAIDHKRGKTNGWSVLGMTGIDHVIYFEVAAANSTGPALAQPTADAPSADSLNADFLNADTPNVGSVGSEAKRDLVEENAPAAPAPAIDLEPLAPERPTASDQGLESGPEKGPAKGHKKGARKGHKKSPAENVKPVEREAASLEFTLQQQAGEEHVLGRFRLAATTHPRPIPMSLTPKPPADIVAIIKLEVGARTSANQKTLRDYFRSRAPQLAAARLELASARQALAEFEKNLPKCIVSSSGPPRTVRILPRGNWMDDSGEVVQPALPQFLVAGAAASSAGAPARLTRLDLANWLISRDNPLTARVVVNRLWKQFFGIGLVKTLDDLGSQGEWPQQPELLDWLACEFMDSGWDVKHMVRLMVTSQTYRQSSIASKDMLARDPDNRWLARQSRFRLDAELVRDSVLSVSGLLVPKIGGPSVKPYQPDGYWENLNFPPRKYEADTGENQYRRGLYTWWQRSFLHPSLLAFDAPTREECAADRTRSNIPQQALALLNDPSYVEAARALAARILTEGPGDAEGRIAWAWRQTLQRMPRPEETATLRSLLDKELAIYRDDKAAAAALEKVGNSPPPSGPNATGPGATQLDIAELAAWTCTARALLNLHETITRN